MIMKRNSYIYRQLLYTLVTPMSYHEPYCCTWCGWDSCDLVAYDKVLILICFCVTMAWTCFSRGSPHSRL